MRSISLTQGKVAVVDDHNFDWLNEWKWYAQRVQNGAREVFYAARALPRVGGRQEKVYMHQQIGNRLGFIQVDHRDLNGLNNLDSNLRDATNSQNRANSGKMPGTSSRFKGVSWFSRKLKWAAQVTVFQRKVFLGYFVDEIDAALAYDRAARFFFGEFARCNFCHQTL